MLHQKLAGMVVVVEMPVVLSMTFTDTTPLAISAGVHPGVFVVTPSVTVALSLSVSEKEPLAPTGCDVDTTWTVGVGFENSGTPPYCTVTVPPLVNPRPWTHMMGPSSVPDTPTEIEEVPLSSDTRLQLGVPHPVVRSYPKKLPV